MEGVGIMEGEFRIEPAGREGLVEAADMPAEQGAQPKRALILRQGGDERSGRGGDMVVIVDDRSRSVRRLEPLERQSVERPGQPRMLADERVADLAPPLADRLAPAPGREQGFGAPQHGGTGRQRGLGPKARLAMIFPSGRPRRPKPRTGEQWSSPDR